MSVPGVCAVSLCRENVGCPRLAHQYVTCMVELLAWLPVCRESVQDCRVGQCIWSAGKYEFHGLAPGVKNGKEALRGCITRRKEHAK